MTFFGQVVSGSAPAWTFSTLVGEASLATTDAPAWASALTSPPADSIASTNDLFIDDRTGDAHLLARSTAGAVVYYHRPESGSWSSASVVAAATFRARWLVTDSTIAIISGPNTGGLELRRFARADLVRGAALPSQALRSSPSPSRVVSAQCSPSIPKRRSPRPTALEGCHSVWWVRGARMKRSTSRSSPRAHAGAGRRRDRETRSRGLASSVSRAPR